MNFPQYLVTDLPQYLVTDLNTLISEPAHLLISEHIVTDKFTQVDDIYRKFLKMSRYCKADMSRHVHVKGIRANIIISAIILQ